MRYNSIEEPIMANTLNTAEINQLLADKCYEEAKEVLRTCSDPAAAAWLTKLEERFPKVMPHVDPSIAQAEQGKFECIAYSSKIEIKGSTCWLAENTGMTLTASQEGLQFGNGPEKFWRGKNASAVGNQMNTINMFSTVIRYFAGFLGDILVKAATTESVKLTVPWAHVREILVQNLSNGCKRVFVLFDNQPKNRLERMELGFATIQQDGPIIHFLVGEEIATENRVAEIFVDQCKAHNVGVEDNVVSA